MTAPEFSRPGEPPTEYEVELLRAAAKDSDSDWLWVARQLIDSLGEKAGTHALLVVLDTLGTEKVHVQPRERFLRSLRRAPLQREALRLRREEKLSFVRIGKRLGISRHDARYLVQSADDSRRNRR